MSNKIKYLIATILLFILCIFIVILFSKQPFIRGFVGDVVIVMLLFCFFKIFKNFDSLRLSIGVTLFAYFIEFTQYIKIIPLLGLKENYFTKIVFGSVFDPMDLLAYTIGGIAIYLLTKQSN